MKLAEVYKRLLESKQAGILYHYTSKAGLDSILKNNELKASEEIYKGQDIYFISFTRNKLFHKKNKLFGVNADYRITLDGDKLSNRYKITPFAYIPGHDYTENWEYDWLNDEDENTIKAFFTATREYDEQEERIWFNSESDKIKNIKSYILKIDKIT